jgi:hypothetical protein
MRDFKEDVVGNILAGTRRRVGTAAARNVEGADAQGFPADADQPVAAALELLSWIAAARRMVWNGEI